MRTINDRLCDETIAHALFLSRYSTGVAWRMVKTLNQADAELSAALFAALEDISPESVTVRRLSTLLGGVREINRRIYQRLYGALTDELETFIGYEAGFQFRLFDALLPVQVKQGWPLTELTLQQVYAAATAQPFQGHLLGGWVDKLEADRIERITHAVSQGYS